MWRFMFRLPAPSLEVSVCSPAPCSYWERVALFTVALAKDRAPALLEHLAPSARERARARADGLARQPSSERQAQLAVEFGEAPGAPGRLRALLEEVSSELAAEIRKRIPAYHQGSPSRPLEPEAPPTPLMLYLAERLTREALQ
jgi:hypothetical protein